MLFVSDIRYFPLGLGRISSNATHTFPHKDCKAVRTSAIQLQYKKKLYCSRIVVVTYCTCADRLTVDLAVRFSSQQSIAVVLLAVNERLY